MPLDNFRRKLTFHYIGLSFFILKNCGEFRLKIIHVPGVNKCVFAKFVSLREDYCQLGYDAP
jgi:hypothetical protein